MAHYFDIHSIDKDFVEGIKVISCLDNERFEEKMVSVLKIVRCDFNSVFRNYFGVGPEWDNDHFVIEANQVQFLIQELKNEFAKGDIGEIYDIEQYHKVITCLETMAANSDPDATYVLSWEK